jgi:DMSO/TMAO reductase YedYZ molybdopterin-dependent catalytic subunit
MKPAKKRPSSFRAKAPPCWLTRSAAHRPAVAPRLSAAQPDARRPDAADRLRSPTIRTASTRRSPHLALQRPRAGRMLFDPSQLAPTYPKRMITRPFPFNAYYGEDEIREVDGADWRLELSGCGRPRAMDAAQLRALPQQSQITRHICVEGLERHRQMGRRAVRPLPAPRRRRPSAKYVGFKCADDYFTSIDMADRAASATLMALTYDDQPVCRREIWLPDEAAHAHQAGLQESETHPSHIRHQYLPWRLLGRPGL